MVRAAGLLVAFTLASNASAHRLDEYLQATLLGLSRTGVDVEMQLTPGIAVFPSVLTLLDRNLDGRLSPEEEASYAQWVARDLELRIDGEKVPLAVVESHFSSLQEMHEGLGSIRLKMRANGAGSRLEFRNHHVPELSAYLVNCLATPGDGLTVGKQDRDESQRSIGFVYSFAQGPPPPWQRSSVALLVGLGVVAVTWRILRRRRA